MCGIAGLIGEALPSAEQTRMQRMLKHLERRGPDSEGIQEWPAAVLGHRRLSIFDLSDAGRQPMALDDGSVAVVFNGAIYNFRVLRQELEAHGSVFRSQTDTEILLHGYRQWGIEGLVARIRGMYAIGLWDAREKRCYLIRDRLGVKPLLYAEAGGRVAFASTAAALAAGGFAGDLDPLSVAEYLEFGYVTDQRVIYQGLKKVPAGTVVELRPGHGVVRQWRYWDLPEVEREKPLGFEDALAQTEELFLDAVRLRLQADVAVGALLSGGVDSGLVCWAVAKLGGDVTAFTVSTPDDPGDETADARETARELGIRHEVISMSGDHSPEAVVDLCRAYGEPFGCSSALGMLQVSQAVRPHATVLLTGDGGDDVFLGYPEHKHFLLAQRLAGYMPEPLAAGWRTVGKDVFPRPEGVLKRAAHLMDYVAGGLGAVAHAHDGLPFYGRALGPRLRDVQIGQRQMKWGGGEKVLAEFLRYDYQTRFTGEYMTKVDGGTMYYSLEARSPFLDTLLWEHAARLPYQTRLCDGKSKALLRALASRKISPRVAEGKKRGFSIPAYHWMTNRWAGAVTEAFADPELARQGWIDKSGLQEVWKRTLERGQSAPKQLWYLFVLEKWLRLRQGA